MGGKLFSSNYFSCGSTPRSSTGFSDGSTPGIYTGYYVGGTPEIYPQAAEVSMDIPRGFSGSSSVLLSTSSFSLS